MLFDMMKEVEQKAGASAPPEPAKLTASDREVVELFVARLRRQIAAEAAEAGKAAKVVEVGEAAEAGKAAKVVEVGEAAGAGKAVEVAEASAAAAADEQPAG